jgi:hypothetical protein
MLADFMHSSFELPDWSPVACTRLLAPQHVFHARSSERYGMQFNSEKIITNFEPAISGKEYRQFSDMPARGKKKPVTNHRLL